MSALRLLAAVYVFALTVSAGPVAVGLWYEFSFFDAGTFATGCFPADPLAPECIPSSGTPTVFADAPPWTLSVMPNGAVLTVTDVLEHGDAFDVYNFGVLLASTAPAVPADFISCGDDPVPCLADPLISRTVVSLAPGAYSLTIAPYASPYGGGAAYFRIDAAPVPEPRTTLLTAAVLLTLCRLCRRK